MVKILITLALGILCTTALIQAQQTETIAPTERKVLTLMSAAGLPELYPAIEAYLHQRKHEFLYFPPDFYERLELERAVLNHIRYSLTDEDMNELLSKFKNPFVSKISKFFISPVDDEIKFTNYISKYGRRAKVERLSLLAEINKIILSDSYLLDLKVKIERAIKIQELRKTPEHVSSSQEKLSQAADDLLSEAIENYKKAQSQYMVQSLFYNNRNITDIELSEFKRLFAKDDLMLKYFRLQKQGLENYFSILFQRLTIDKDRNQTKKNTK